MITVLYGPSGSGKSRRMLEELCRSARAGVAGQVLLVPDLMSHETERALAAAGGSTICRFAEVLSFSRLASRVFARYGGLAQVSLDGAGQMLAMARAVDTVRERLAHYGAVVTQPEYLSAFLKLGSELKSYCVTAEELKALSARVQGSLAGKLADLSLIYEAYDAVCAQTAADPRDQLTRLAEALDETGWARGRHIYIDGFTFFTLQEQRVLERFVRDAEQVTVALTLDETGGTVFDLARQTRQELRTMAGRYGRPFTQRAMNDLPQGRRDLNLLSGALLTGVAAPEGEPEGAVRALWAEDAVTACAWTAWRIAGLVRSGVRYRQIALAWPAGSSYETLMRSALEDWGIPVNLTAGRDILQTSVCSMVTAALDVVTGDWRREDVFRYLKTGFSGLEADAVDRLENYAILWNLRGGGRWSRPFTAHPGGFDAREDPAPVLEALNAWRAQAAAPLLALSAGLKQARDVAGQVQAVYGFLEQLDLAGQLTRLAEALTQAGRGQQAQEYSQLYSIVLQALEQLYSVSGTLTVTPERFARLLELLLGQYKVSAIPAVLDAVAAGELAAMRHKKPDYLFVLGADEGQMPAAPGADSLLTELERQTLQELGVGLAPDAEYQLSQQLLDIYMVFSSPVKGLWVLSTGEHPAFPFTRVETLFGPAQTVQAPPPETLAQAAAWAARNGGAAVCGQVPELAELTESLRSAAGYALGTLAPAQVQSLYAQPLRLTISRLELWAACRFHHFCTYGLKLKERAQAGFDAPAFGNFAHAVLEKLLSQVRREGGFEAVSDERLLALTAEYQADYAENRLGGLADKEARFVYLYQRNGREMEQVVRALGRELRASAFQPEHLELSFGASGRLPAIPIQGDTVQALVSGVVDRVDLYRREGENFLRVVDYKTGSKTFDFTDLRHGLSLQMPVYLFALAENGLGQPAAVVYYPARSSLVTTDHRLDAEAVLAAREKKNGTSGLVSGEEGLLDALGTPLKSGVYPVTGEQWTQLERFIRRSTARAADGIAGGGVEPDPYTRGGASTACARCSFAPVCHRAPDAPMRYLAPWKADEFWTALAEEETQHE